MYISDITASDKNISRQYAREENERKKKKNNEKRTIFEKPRKSDRRRSVGELSRAGSGISSIRRFIAESGEIVSCFAFVFRSENRKIAKSRTHAERLIEAAGTAGNLHHPLLPALYRSTCLFQIRLISMYEVAWTFNEVVRRQERIRGRMYFCRER
jgi:uncharacterized protein (DUF2344 family)